VVASCVANNGGAGAEAFRSLLRALGTGGLLRSLPEHTIGEITQHPAVFESLLGSGVPGGKAAPVANLATGTTRAGTGTWPAAANRTTFIRSCQVGALGTSGAAVTISNLAVGTLTFQSVAGQSLTFTFDPPLPATGQNTTITVSAAANAIAVLG